MTFPSCSFIIPLMLTNKNLLCSVIFFRFGIATLILIANTALFGLVSAEVYSLITAVYLLTIFYSVLLLAKVYNKFFLYLQVITDLVIETILVHYTGGADSVLVILFPLSIIASSVIVSPRAAVVTALLASVLYSALISLEFFKIIPLTDIHASFILRDSSYVFSLLYFRVTVFCIIGFLSAYIAEQLNKKDKVVFSLQEKLRQENRLSSIGKLAANTAHEIRNPLASISGCVESLKESLPLEPKNERLFALIIKETARLNDIINGLLEYVKPRKLQVEQISINGFLEEVIFLVKNSKDFKEGIEIKKENESKDIKITCDPPQIKQVFFNLFINAVEAVEKNGKIIVRTAVDEQNKQLEISVQDNGIGMDDEQMSRLFEPFSSGKVNGVGLGLAIASTIITEHNGTIKVESKKGKGTTFRVILPLFK